MFRAFVPANNDVALKKGLFISQLLRIGDVIDSNYFDVQIKNS
jgi:hypothetical protein